MDDVTIDVPGTPTILFRSATGVRGIGSLLTREAITFSGGRLDLTGNATLEAGIRVAGGAIAGGMIVGAAGITFSGTTNRFDGIVVAVSLNLGGGNFESLNGLTLNGVATIDNGNSIRFTGTQTLGGNGQVFFPTGNVVNDGTISADSGAYLRLQSGTFVNNGALEAKNNGNIELLGTSSTNNSTIAANGGIVVVE